MPTASIVNYRSGEMRANATIVAIGVGGRGRSSSPERRSACSST